MSDQKHDAEMRNPAQKTDKYIVATDAPALSRHAAARLYRIIGYRSRAELAGSGSLEQMEALAEKLNGEAHV